MTTGIVWFRNDLRIDDHEPLDEAAKDCDALICVYSLADKFFENDPLGFPVVGANRRQFLAQSLRALDAALRERGQYLVLRRQNAKVVLNDLAREHGPLKVYAFREPGTEELTLEESIGSDHNVSWFWGKTLIHPDDLPFPIDDLPHVFTAFRGQIEKNLKIRPLIQTRKLPPSPLPVEENDFFRLLEVPPISPDVRSILPFNGGLLEGHERLQHYFWETNAASHYVDTRNDLLGANHSGKFSPWLANGSLSPRQIYAEILRFEEERTKNKSTYWLFFELLWRDFFQFTLLKHKKALFRRTGILNKIESWQQNFEQFETWRHGLTGLPFVDANLRELKSTGWMSNRGRQNVASFLAKTMCIDWTWGARWFESQLIDYDAGSNWGNWNYISGVGNDPRPNRWFNVISQAERYDPDGAYVRCWLPELKDVPKQFVHTPFKLPRSGLELLTATYPRPDLNWVVEHSPKK